MANRAISKTTVLWICPTPPDLPPLQWAAELGGIEQLPGVEMHSLVGPAANTMAIGTALALGAEDVVIWSGHGRENGLMTTEGVILSGQWIAMQIKAGAPRIFLVGACFSGSVDEFLQSITEQVSEAGVNAIGFQAAANDRAAAVYAIEFVRALTADAAPNAAHRLARQECSKINKATAASVIFQAGIVNGLSTVLQAIKTLGIEVHRNGDRIVALEEQQAEILLQIRNLPMAMRGMR